MRPRRRLSVVLVAVVLAALSACAPKVVPVPVITTLAYPDYILPPVPPAMAGSQAAAAHDRAWRFLQTGDLKSAEREATLALQASPAFYPADAMAGYVELARKEPKSALARFDKALERQNGYLSALVGRGRALQALERDDDAIAAYEAAIALDGSLTDLSRQIDVLRFRGAERQIAQARQAGRSNNLGDARTAYERAIATSPDSAFLYRELAAIEQKAGDGEAALRHYRKALELDPADASSLGQVGELLEATGDLDGALKAYADALALEPNDRLAQRREAINARMELARLPEEYRAIDSAPQITRAQLAALIGIRLARQIEGFPRTEPGVITDIRGNWAERWIVAVARAGVMEPFANHTFQPRAVVRRADLAPIAGRLILRISPPQDAKTWQSAKTPFTDLAPGHLAYPSASTAVASGVMSKTADGAFRPSQPVTGADAIAMVERIERLSGSGVTVRSR